MKVDDVIYRQAVLDLINANWTYEPLEIEINCLPSAQPEITDEQAIEHLRSTGWMQNHDREMYDMGLKEQLADDSGSYDSLLPSAQPEIIKCRECTHHKDEIPGMVYCPKIVGGWVSEDCFCSYAERRTDEQT